MSKEVDKDGFEEKELDIQIKKEEEVEENKADSPKARAKWIPIDTIDFDDRTYQVREKEDPDTLERYEGMWRECLEIRDKKNKYPFDGPIILELSEDGKYRIVSGWHRAISAKNVGVPAIFGRVESGTMDELLQRAMQENDKNGLSTSRGDIKYSIRKIQELHPDWAPPIVIAFLGKGSPSYAAQIEREAREAGTSNVPAKRLGKDGKHYSVTKKKGRKNKPNLKKKVSKAKVAKKTVSRAKNDRVDEKGQGTEDSMSMIFDSWQSNPFMLGDTLDSFEQCLVSDSEKSNMYVIIKHWLERRISLYSNQDVIQSGTEEQ